MNGPTKNQEASPGDIMIIEESAKGDEILSKSNALLTAVVNQAHFAIHILEGEFNNINVVIENDESARIMGEVVEGRRGIDSDIPEMLITRFFTPDGKQEIPLSRMPGPRAFLGEVVTNEEILFRHADGTEILASASASPVYDKYNKIMAATVIFHDITEQSITLANLRESNEKYRALIETTDTGYLIMDSGGKVIDANQEYIRLTGHKTLNEIIGKSIFLWTLKLDEKKNIAAVKQCLDQGYIKNMEINYIDESGVITPIEINAKVVKTDDGSRVLALCRDITERKETETRLRRYSLELEDMVKARTAELTEANQQLRREIEEREETGKKLRQVSDDQKVLLSTIPASVYLKDRSGKYITANRVFAEMAGKNVEEITGKTDYDLFPEDNARQHRENDREVMESGKAQHNTEGEYYTGAGQVIWTSTSKAPLFNDAGEVVGLAGITLDITGRKLAEQALLESEERFCATFESSGIGKVLTELNGSFFRINDAMCSMMGFSEEEILSMSIKEITHPDDLLESNDYVENLLQGNFENDTFVLEKRFLHKNRDIILGRVHVCLIRNQQGEPIHMMAEIEDINERKRTEDALKERMKELEIFYDATVDRELRMEELRKEIRELKKQKTRMETDQNKDKNRSPIGESL